MVIHPSGLFDHTAVLRRDHTGVWRGRAGPNEQDETLVGDTPQVELAGGTLTLVRTQFEWPGVFRRDRDPLTARVALPVGPAFEAVLQDEDEIRTLREGTGDLAATLTRNGQLQIALGAVHGLLASAGITVEMDPRARDVDFYGVARMVKRPDVKLFWLDPGDPNLELHLAEINHVSPDVQTVIVVARGGDRAKLRDLNQRVFSPRRPHGSWWFEVAPERVRTESDLMAYLEQLPGTRPEDLWLRFTIDGRTHEVREGEYQQQDPWHLFVARVYTPGIPGELSQLGVARVHPALSAETFTSSVRRIATGSLNFDA
ncbi:MAG TPA: hypothetical protein VH679_09890 [Vicinamibacterales bacterium]|jgi:hypothetical protein